jgi:hypothetical protein
MKTRVYGVAFSPDPRRGCWRYGQKVRGLAVRESTSSPGIEHKKDALLSTVETMPDRFPRAFGDGEAEPGVSDITNRRWELAGSGYVE